MNKMRSRSARLRLTAARLLAEMEDEQTWKTQFESTTDEQWDRMAEMVRQEITNGKISPLDDVFPS